jgi:hypothetical protein
MPLIDRSVWQIPNYSRKADASAGCYRRGTVAVVFGVDLRMAEVLRCGQLATHATAETRPPGLQRGRPLYSGAFLHSWFPSRLVQRIPTFPDKRLIEVGGEICMYTALCTHAVCPPNLFFSLPFRGMNAWGPQLFRDDAPYVPTEQDTIHVIIDWVVSGGVVAVAQVIIYHGTLVCLCRNET